MYMATDNFRKKKTSPQTQASKLFFRFAIDDAEIATTVDIGLLGGVHLSKFYVSDLAIAYITVRDWLSVFMEKRFVYFFVWV